MELPPAAPAPDPAPRTPLPWYRRPYLQLAQSILLNGASQPFLWVGVAQVKAEHGGAPEWQMPLFYMWNGWVLTGIACIIVSLLGWLYALKTVPLNIAFNLSGVTHILVPLLSLWFLGDRISGLRWLGIGLVALGVIVTAKEVVRLEEKL